MARTVISNIKKIRQEIERLKKHSESAKKEWIDEGYNQNAFAEDCRIKSFDKLLDFIDTLPDENNPEPYNPVYDEDYLNEKIAKATKSWEGVDVNKMLADCRGYEEKPSEDFPTSDEEMAKFLATHPKVEVPEKYKTPNWLFDKQPSEDLEEAANKYAILDEEGKWKDGGKYKGFIAGAEWQRLKDKER